MTVLEVIKQGEVTKKEIMEKTGLCINSVCNHLNALIVYERYSSS